MPWPRVALIIEKPDGIFLERYLTDGTLVGDTWHEELEHAKEQAFREYGELLGPWTDVPEDLAEEELVRFAISAPPSSQ